ncbi:glycosyltransferase family 2 protein [Cellulomonas xylanilytica]|uniref:glycosyltransferase family 2 protein n=1 Tax=Cellulomonas xylanilytica TaxID=233583 RepID=UPI001C990E80|nr:glycosyltransferase family 2 protein [Cellulomonas xylanilytica]
MTHGDPTVDLVLPCLDEAAALAWLLPRVPPGLHVIVVDNGSTDDTAAVARELGARVVREDRRGFGAACHAGLLAATADVVAFMDADGSLDPRQLHRVLDPLLEGADLVLGRRRPTSGAAWPWHLRVANKVLVRRLEDRTGVRLGDLGPMRAARRAALLELDLHDRRSGYPLEMVVRAADDGWRITEVEVDYGLRTGRSKVTGTPLGVIRAVRDMSAVLAS